MSRYDDIAHLKNEVSRVTHFVDQMTGLLPGLAELARLAVNIDRLGPRLELIDRIGPRLDVLDSLATLVEPLKSLAARIQLLDQLGEVLNQFNGYNHAVAESVRVDVETISALALQVELFNRQLMEQLEKVIRRD